MDQETAQENTSPEKNTFFPPLKHSLFILFLMSLSAYTGYWYATQALRESKTSSENKKLATQPQKISPTPSQTDPTAGWKTHTSSQYDYTIKLPPDWVFYSGEELWDRRGTDVFANYDCRQELGCGGEKKVFHSQDQIIVSVIKTLHEWSSSVDIKTHMEKATGAQKIKEVTLGILRGFRGVSLGLRGGEDAFVYYFPASPGSIYRIVAYPSGSKLIPLLELALSTLRFRGKLENIDLSSWKRYTSKDFSFTISHPPTLFLHVYSLEVSSEPKALLRLENPSQPLDFPEITLTVARTDLDLESWLKKRNACPSSFDSCTELVPGPLENSVRYETLNRHYTSLNTLFKKDDLVFEFAMSAKKKNTPLSSEQKELYEKILATFNFLD